ncbi:MAG: Fic family protein [Mycobacteriales bacterium]
MRSFERDVWPLAQVPGTVARTLAKIDVGRGAEALHAAHMPGLLSELALRARVASVKASSALEGVVVPDERRADRIISGAPLRLRTRSEQELAGYRDALDYVWQADWQPVNVGLVLHLHRLLLGHTAAGAAAGVLKPEDNLVVDKHAGGSRTIRFKPVSASRAPYFMDELVDRYAESVRRDAQHPVLLAGLAVLDLLVIHPFEDGNGRVARILTTALLSQCGYTVGRYVSLEQLVAETDERYYAALLASTHGWHEAEHDAWPWLEYFVEQLARAYALFEERASSAEGGGSKRDRVKDHVLCHAPARFRIADLRAALPGIGDGTIRNALDDLRNDGRVEVDGPGRGATWTRY